MTQKKLFNQQKIEVSKLHTIDVREYGNPEGIPVVVLHGGPGGGCVDSYTEFFNLDHWRVVMFDQRGCGKSTPFAELKENTTWDLIDDIEKIRDLLNIKEWHVFGGSWGSTLSLSYACSFPDRCRSLILRGIFLCRQKELDWFYEKDGGASCMYPDAHQKFYQVVEDVPGKNIFEKYYSLLTHSDQSIRHNAAKAWSVWEASTSKLIPDEGLMEDFAEPNFAEAFARIECHYFINGAFFDKDTEILARVDKIKHIPIEIVQGRYDVVCPPVSAWELKQALPHANLYFMNDSGHSSTEKSISKKLQVVCADIASKNLSDEEGKIHDGYYF